MLLDKDEERGYMKSKIHRHSRDIERDITNARETRTAAMRVQDLQAMLQASLLLELLYKEQIAALKSEIRQSTKQSA